MAVAMSGKITGTDRHGYRLELENPDNPFDRVPLIKGDTRKQVRERLAMWIGRNEAYLTGPYYNGSSYVTVYVTADYL